MLEDAMTRFFWVAIAACVFGLGCGAQAAQKPPASVQRDATQMRLTSENLAGLWVEFWAVTGGHTDTQRYAFFPDGRFGWRAASSSQENVVWRFGAARLGADGREIVLTVQGQADRACQDAVCRTHYDPALVERISLGACPPNDEAQSIDADYLCASFNGRAFWRHAHHAPEVSAYLPN